MPAALPALPKLHRPAWLSLAVARTEVLAGLVVALALIPEAISFSILAGVSPRPAPTGASGSTARTTSRGWRSSSA